MSKYERLIDMSSRGGMACLCFPNDARFSLAQITEIFSVYGEIVGINCAGNETGFRFVRFRTKEQAMDCVMALDDDPRIRFQPVKSKARESNDNTQRDQSARNKRENVNGRRNNQTLYNGEDNDKADSLRGSQSSKKSQTNKDNRVQNDMNGNNHSNHTNNDLGKENYNNQRSPTGDLNPTVRTANSRTLGNFPKTKESNYEGSENQNSNNHQGAAKFAQLRKLRGTNANTFQPPNNDLVNDIPAVPAALSATPFVTSPPHSHHSNKGQFVVPDVPPPLISGVPCLQSVEANVPVENIAVVLASDIVLANIHSNIGVSNIHHMLKKFSPIYISDIETVPDVNVRFCYVYFDTPRKALEVEQLFDGASVHGQNLITLRPHRLEVESGVF